MKKPKVKMVTVRYKGKSPIGTMIPRRMWRPGDKAKITPKEAEILLNNKNFVTSRIIKPKKKKATKPKPVTKPKPQAKDDPPQGEDKPPEENPEEVIENPSTQPPEE